ncbi:MAG TPA: prolyl oligopeptidase family serine peptidase [Tepidisphaeraceae bacterium]|nr:prolyl oligopeptidase family serine peptidase [Tepidisphaeraceae bacterium]
MPRRRIELALLTALLMVAPEAIAQTRRGGNPQTMGVYKSQIVPNWLADNTRFWYRNDLRDGGKEFILVDPAAGTRGPAFDHQRLASALSKAIGKDVTPDRLSFNSIEFIDDSKAIRFQASDVTWKCTLDSYECTRAAAAPLPATQERSLALPPQSTTRPFRAGRNSRSPRSGDGKWTAFIKDHNVFVRFEADAREIQLSTDGRENFDYGRLEWSPDSSVVVAFRIEAGEHKEVYRVESSPRGGGRAVLHTNPYALPGDRFDSLELNLFEVSSQKQIKPLVDRIDMSPQGGDPNPVLHWNRDGFHFAYEKADRGHQRLRLIEVDGHNGEARNIIDEKSDTFNWTAHAENLALNLINWLQKSDEIIYVSERDGWRHMYLIDARTGAVKNPITSGPYVLRAIDRIDENSRQVWFRACGKNPDQDPYFIHYYRVNFDGTGLVQLTEGNGSHSIQYSPDRRYLIDSYSRVDMPPVNELRRTSDGSLLCKLEEADISELGAKGWHPPEVFVARGRDGKTDIWGIISRPPHLDPNKKYPVLEVIYNGPQSAYVPKTFSAQQRFSTLTELGFIVVQMDAMGTAFRSKAFHDVCWHNLGDAGFPDRILWHKAAAAKYPYYDLDRVGIFGTSAGGQNAAGAVIFHPEFYKAAVANSGCHDNRMDKASWNEQWMGYPVGDWYSKSSNIDNAAKLGGHLMLIVGEMDNNVPPESTYRFADALIKAGKDFDLVVIPGANHGAPSPITQRHLQDFFLLHLQGMIPPNRNAQNNSGSR